MNRITDSALRWLRRTVLACQLAGRFFVELLVANVQQARLILSTPLEVQPRWIQLETQLQSRTSRTVLGALISLTPGTLTCDLKQNVLLIHALSAPSDVDALDQIRQRFESLLIRIEEIR